MRKDVVVNMRVRKTALGVIDKAAEIEGKTRSAFLRDCAQRAAADVVLESLGKPKPIANDDKSS